MAFGVIHSLFRLSVPHGRLQGCIEELENALKAVSETQYHSILGRDFLHHLEDVADFIADFYIGLRNTRPISAMYFEMNGFEINPKRWYFNGFAYEKEGDIWDLTWNHDWLCPWDEQTEEFTLTGMEPIQKAFEEQYGDGSEPLALRIAAEITMHIVTARFQQLIGAAHQLAKSSCEELNGFPILSTAHEWDVLFPSQ